MTLRCLLFSDLHFKSHELDRVWQTAKWIAAEAERHRVRRVLSRCYRFIGCLSDAIPQVHILLGNHDLAYRRDYQTTALDAFNINRLAPYVTIHKDIAQHEWDGRRVLLLPFREDQSELTNAVASLSPDEARKTVAFAHLAINKAITQRYIVGTGFKSLSGAKSIVYNGLTGPDHFASLARTFTGHFHSHQTIMQKQVGTSKTDLQGSITYLGSPLQLNWGDLYDEQRGIVLFNPETLEHQMLVNPNVTSYTTADLEQVLNDQANIEAVKDKHVMLLGDLSYLKFVIARDKLLSLGARSVRDWSPMGFKDRAALGSSVPASDASVQPLEEPRIIKSDVDTTSDGVSSSALDSQPRVEKLDFTAEARKSTRGISTRSATDLKGPSDHIFAAVPSTLTIANFLSVQGTITIDFQHDLARGLTFLVGENGSGKSMLIEAIVWCLFGKCIRNGMAVNDVVNDIVGKNCCVTLKFANGYAISRHRKHKENGNRAIVTLHGEAQLEYDHPHRRTTQEAINDLLGINYETYIKTIVLSHESAASFLNSEPNQKRQLTEDALGLSILDTYGKVSRLILKNVDKNVSEIDSLDRKRKFCEEEARNAAASLESAMQEHETARPRTEGHQHLELSSNTSKNQQKLSTSAQEFLNSIESAYSAEFREATLRRISALRDQIYLARGNRHLLEMKLAAMRVTGKSNLISWLVWLKQELNQRLDGVPADRSAILQRLLYAMRTVVTKGAVSVLDFLIKVHDMIDTKHRNLQMAIQSTSKELQSTKWSLQSLHFEARDIIRQTKDANRQALLETEKQLMEVEEAQNVCADVMIKEEQAMASQQEELIFKQQHEARLKKQRENVIIKRHEASTYANLIEQEQLSLQSIRQRYDELALKLRELAQILTALYDDTRHTKAITTGILSSLFDSESGGSMQDEYSELGPVLDQSLAVHHSLAYGKRSGGERKRLDLALFFALLHLCWAESAHRAHYLLIDEVFDSLDEAGQEAVVRWCMIMLQSMVGWIVMVTHSRFLAERDPERDAGRAMVVRIKMGSQGTEIYKDEQRIGIDSRTWDS
ncbi:hypothetical protein FBEOM_13229 [Fusarium beomiforme]|uniref:Rad50/SbcC-type AAA domain-containing protein n=1 Tax=Fusarium beomiforme TaxID=44412 RepID=A0A9P5A6N4_9HYPO|nr:hypothetical protein FBEOM_13229 [Fusarium beomiforme]